MDSGAIFAIVIFAVGGGLLVFAGMSQRTEVAVDDPEAYLRSLDEDYDETDEFQALLQEPFLHRVLRPLGSKALGSIASLLPANYRDSIRQKLVYAGLAGQYRPEELIVAQVLGGGGMVVLSMLYIAVSSPSTGMSIILLGLLPAVGALAPSAWLNRKVQERKDAILRDLPDTLDLLAISVEAGVGFEGALGIVCEHFDSPLAEEFSRTLKEMELGLPRRGGPQNPQKKTEGPGPSKFVLGPTQGGSPG